MDKNLELPQLNQLDVSTLEKMIENSKKFCTSCMLTKPEVGGELVIGVRKRWRCAQCKARVATQLDVNKRNKHD